MQRDPYTTWVIAQERIRCRMQEAEKERLAQLAMAGRSAKRRFCQRMLAWTGCLMITLGWRLWKRYGAVSCATNYGMRSAINGRQ